jgi:hypothetical protein
MRNLRTSAHISRTVAGVAVAGLTAGLGLVGPAAHAATPQATSSSDWLVSQLSSGLVESEYHDGKGWVGYTDFGLTLDFFYAFDQLGVRKGQQTRILDAIEPRAAEYTDAWGTTYAGATGKLLTAVLDKGIAPGSYAKGDLLPKLETLVVDSGPERGRGKDDTTGSDTSNTFGQSYVVTALAAAGSSERAAATRFLLKQQCGAGFFRESMDSRDFTCDSAAPDQRRPDVDATATAAIALRKVVSKVPVGLRAEVRTALRDATRWLAARQVKNGTFTGARNSNSTGLAAVALKQAGNHAAARKAARWVNNLRVTKKMVSSSKLRARDIGAIAYDVAGLDAAKKQGLARGDRYVWRRATAQAAPALDAL